ncbi:CehA/McbA family metallohydrolase [Singulisphaera sp. PoT]|uniref:CehA/McbA family metallohydrolase n=1 Tax=Singulisphaera sp. PoT TaxID=3411797 RepID=UPI003BF4AFE8
MNRISFKNLALCASLCLMAGTAHAADLVSLSPETWERFAPQGKEADAIYGDFTLANDQIIAVIAHPRRKRNANMTVREVGGCIIDLTRRDRQSDQLSAYYPGAQARELKFGGIDVQAPSIYEISELERTFVKARKITMKFVAQPREKTPDVAVSYTLEDGLPYVLVTTDFSNHSNETVSTDLIDSLRADNSFEKAPEAYADLYWAYDKAFGQAYGWLAEKHQIIGSGGRQLLLKYRNHEGKLRITLAPGETYRLARKLAPGANLFDVQRFVEQGTDKAPRPIRLTVKDTAGQPVVAADVALETDGKKTAWGRTDEKGTIEIAPPKAAGILKVTSAPHGSKSLEIKPDAPEALSVELPEPGKVVAKIVDAKGGPIPCKVQFIGRDGTPSPDFGPDSGEHAIRNVYYSHDGKFRRELEPGRYDVIISYGTEYDAVFTRLDVKRGQETTLEGKLVRTVQSPGWVSADFHSHSSPSGDNTASQLGRVLNLLCEQIEFAPCTEHNRISTYTPHLQRLGVEPLIATCSGMEMTGQPLPLNHQNAFPLVMKPNTQDNGAPPSADDPEFQIERLALWDGRSEKLVQVNHPDMGWMFFDRNGDGNPDGGYSGMVGHIDVIEVHPPHLIFDQGVVEYEGRKENNPIFNWMQLLNQGKRIPGVVNTDAHYNFHGSGFLRSYLKCPTDDPSKIETLDMVHAAERGNVVMSNGPFLEVKLKGGESGNGSASTESIPGDDVAIPGGKATLQVRVQCPNWFDVDRVQVFLNGRPVDSLNFTKKQAADKFKDGVVKFEQEIPITLERDTHVIVATIGEGSKLGPVMGPDHEKDLPVAVSNPIFVDVDGGGFTANKDTLGSKLPVKGGH